MRFLTVLASLAVASCDTEENSSAETNSQGDAAKRHFAQYDQITAVATAKPSAKKFAYELRIRNVGSEPIIGLGETSQQWQTLEKDAVDLSEWSEHIPISTDGNGTFELAPGENFTCEVEPSFRQGARIWFGFLVFTQVGDDDHRRMRIWTETRIPESDFSGLLQPSSNNKTNAQQVVDPNRSTAPLLNSESSVRGSDD